MEKEKPNKNKKEKIEEKVAEAANKELNKSSSNNQEKKEENHISPNEALQKTETSVASSKKQVSKKEEVIARGLNMPISKKHSMFICSFIKNKTIDSAIADLELVKKFKRAVPFKGEIPHRKGMMSGRYPIKASLYFINLLKGLRGNALTNGFDLEKTFIVWASASWASRPMKRGGMRFKRTNVTLIAKEINLKNNTKEEK